MDVPAALAALQRRARTEGAEPLPMTGYKLALVEGTVLETLERASHATPSTVTAGAAVVPESAAAQAEQGGG